MKGTILTAKNERVLSFWLNFWCIKDNNRICGVMVKHARLECGRSWVQARSVKPKTIKLEFVASPLSTQHYGERAKTGWLRIRIMCLSGEQDNSPPDNCPPDNSPPDNCLPQFFFHFIFSFWLPLSDSMNSIALLYFHFKIHSYLSQF